MEYEAVVELSADDAKQVLSQVSINKLHEIHIYPTGALILREEGTIEMGVVNIHIHPIICEFTRTEGSFPSSKRCTGFKIQYKFGCYNFIWVYPGYKIKMTCLKYKNSETDCIKLG